MMMRMMSMVEVMKSGVLVMMLPVTKVGKVEMKMNLQLSMSLRWRRCQCKKGLVTVTRRDEVCLPLASSKCILQLQQMMRPDTIRRRCGRF